MNKITQQSQIRKISATLSVSFVIVLQTARKLRFTMTLSNASECECARRALLGKLLVQHISDTTVHSYLYFLNMMLLSGRFILLPSPGWFKSPTTNFSKQKINLCI